MKFDLILFSDLGLLHCYKANVKALDSNELKADNIIFSVFTGMALKH